MIKTKKAKKNGMKSANKCIDRIANKTGFHFMERVRWSVRGRDEIKIYRLIIVHHWKNQ